MSTPMLPMLPYGSQTQTQRIGGGRCTIKERLAQDDEPQYRHFSTATNDADFGRRLLVNQEVMLRHIDAKLDPNSHAVAAQTAAYTAQQAAMQITSAAELANAAAPILERLTAMEHRLSKIEQKPPPSCADMCIIS
jgi:hypothetical protein